MDRSTPSKLVLFDSVASHPSHIDTLSVVHYTLEALIDATSGNPNDDGFVLKLVLMDNWASIFDSPIGYVQRIEERIAVRLYRNQSDGSDTISVAFGGSTIDHGGWRAPLTEGGKRPCRALVGELRDYLLDESSVWA